MDQVQWNSSVPTEFLLHFWLTCKISNVLFYLLLQSLQRYRITMTEIMIQKAHYACLNTYDDASSILNTYF